MYTHVKGCTLWTYSRKNTLQTQRTCTLDVGNQRTTRQTRPIPPWQLHADSQSQPHGLVDGVDWYLCSSSLPSAPRLLMPVPSAGPEAWKLSCACDMVEYHELPHLAADHNTRLEDGQDFLNLGLNRPCYHIEYPRRPGHIN